MTKLSRKLMFSILSVALAFITLGATTFAWFTLNTTADIQRIETTVTVGTGIEISIDGTTFRSTILIDDIEAEIGEISGYKFDALTSQNGYEILEFELKQVSGGEGELQTVAEYTEATGSTYIEFPLWFRSPTEGARVYLLSGSETYSAAVGWKSDAQFYYPGRGPELEDIVQEGETINIYAADSLRFSFQDYEIEWKTDLKKFSLSPLESAKVFELDPRGRDQTTGGNIRLGKEVKEDSGMVPYFNQKSQIKIDETVIEGVNLPEKVFHNEDLVDAGALVPEVGDIIYDVSEKKATPIVTLNVQKEGDDVFYYGFTMVRIWLEGWDPDCFNAVLGKGFSIYLVFGGGVPATSGDN